MRETFYKIPANSQLTIALISDLHNRKETEVLKSLEQKKPDIIAISGDMVMGLRSDLEGLAGDRPLVEQQRNIIPFLKSSMKIAPTFISLGNHEWFLADEDISTMVSTGAHVLDNRWVEYQVNGHRILIGGLTSVFVDNYRNFRNTQKSRYPVPPKGEKPKIKDPDSNWLSEFEKQDGYKILLSHHPEYWSMRKPMLCERKIDLVLSGHAHGGQIRLFGKGLYAPGQGFFPEYTKGMWMGKHGWLVVSTGLANTLSMVPRFFNPTEVVYVELGNP